jgi:hypothetical protein
MTNRSSVKYERVSIIYLTIIYRCSPIERLRRAGCCTTAFASIITIITWRYTLSKANANRKAVGI